MKRNHLFEGLYPSYDEVNVRTNRKQYVYESIMRTVSKQVKKALNEAFTFESDELGDKIVAGIKRSEAIMKVVKDADENDWKELFAKMHELAQQGEQRVPAKITNLKSLALNLLKFVDMKQVKEDELDDLAMYVMDSIMGDENGAAPKAIADRSGMQSAVESCNKKKPMKECGCEGGKCDCEDGKCDCKQQKNECCGKNCKPQMHESYSPRFARRRRF